MSYTFDDLRPEGGTFRPQVRSGTGRDKVMDYIHGVSTPSGEYKEADWCQMVEDLIDKTGETALQSSLREWVKERCKWLQGRDEIKRYSLELHAARIFDNQSWVDFIPFNRKYRPNAMAGVEVVSLITTCCKTPGQVTRKHLEENSGIAHDGRKTVCCPICGRRSEYELM